MICKSGAVTLAVLAGLVAGCTQPVFLPQSHAVIYATDLQGKAASCTGSSVQPEPGKTVTATLTTGGRGWCAVTVADGGKPYAAGLVERRPEKGHVYIHTVGDDTRVDYTPDAVAAPDTFSVQLLPGNAILTVTVQPAGSQSASAPPSPTQPASAQPASKGVAK